MRIAKTLSAAVLGAVLLVGTGPQPAHSFDPFKIFKSDDKPVDIMRFGFKAYKEGRKDEAAGAFRYAANKNQLAAKWKLGRMFAIGDGIDRNELKAFGLYREIADEYAEIRPKRQDRIFVANAVVAVADYYRRGISGTRVKPNLSLAMDYYYRAAALYGHPKAQYQLGRIYLDGKLGRPQPVQAARWLRAASKKNYPAAQVVLGRMLFEGNGIPRRRVQGLMLMTLAVGNDTRSRVKGQLRWIREWREKAFSKASEQEQLLATELANQSFASTKGLSGVRKTAKSTAPVSLLPKDN